MPLFIYNRDIPDAPNNPSADQPDMKINTNSTDSLISVDHYSFNQNLGGLHKQVQMPNLAAIPIGLIANEGTVYVKSANTTSQLFYTNENSTNEYQLTRTSNADFSTFGNNGGVVDSGWTFLPGRSSAGGMLLQYGLTGVLTGTGNTVITFPKAFTAAPFSVVVTMIRDSNDVDNAYVRSVATVTNTQFEIHNTSSANRAYWMAIGV